MSEGAALYVEAGSSRRLGLALRRMEDPVDAHVMPPRAVPLMPPPSGRPGRQGDRQALSEEAYVEALERIIERDFFPQLEGRVEGGAALAAEHSLDGFLAHYTSEDNASFGEVLERDLQERRRRLPWLFEAEGGRRSGHLNMYHLGGRVLTEEERVRMHLLLDGDEDRRVIGDDRQNAVDPWRFRVQNQLYFPPLLADSEDTCRVPPPLLLLSDPRAASSSRPEGSILRHNTRLPPDTDTGPPPLERPHSPSEYSQADSLDDVPRARAYRPVPMTPSLEPGAGASPILTWGEVAGEVTAIAEPAYLDRSLRRPPPVDSGSGDAQGRGGGSEGAFRIAAESRREAVARSLDSRKAATRRGGGGAARKSGGPSQLTPAALALAERLRASTTPLAPFGGDAALLASYSNRSKLASTPKQPSRR